MESSISQSASALISHERLFCKVFSDADANAGVQPILCSFLLLFVVISNRLSSVIYLVVGMFPLHLVCWVSNRFQNFMAKFAAKIASFSSCLFSNWSKCAVRTSTDRHTQIYTHSCTDRQPVDRHVLSRIHIFDVQKLGAESRSQLISCQLYPKSAWTRCKHETSDQCSPLPSCFYGYIVMFPSCHVSLIDVFSGVVYCN